MKSEWIDISVPVYPGNVPQWPGSDPIKIESKKEICCGQSVNDRNISMNLHTGTHLDAPEHFIDQGATIESFTLDQLIGDCFVVDCGDASEVTDTILESAKIPKHITRILLKTTNSKNWTSTFNPKFVGITVAAAEWLVKNNIVLIGNDYLSIQPYKGDNNIHKVLLKKSVVILEGINLTNVEQGEYELFCLPMKLVKVEAAPARVIIRRKKKGDQK